MDQQSEPAGVIAAQHVGAMRLGIGLLQGLVAWRLLELAAACFPHGNKTHADPVWAQQHPTLFGILALWTALLPLIALAELPRMPWRRLIIYLGVVAAALAGLVAYDFWRTPMEVAGGAIRPCRSGRRPI